MIFLSTNSSPTSSPSNLLFQNTMPKPSILLPLLISYLISTSESRNLPIDSNHVDVPGDFNYVCHPTRFEQLGLDINEFGYCEKSRPYDVRARDLVDMMTLEEKVQQMGDQASGVHRIGLPRYHWWSEALHGVSDFGRCVHFDSNVPGATSFPTVIVTAATFDKKLWKKIGQVVSTEARAMYNLGHAGLTYWSPNINVVRDPRWGRITETPGEDPYVVGMYAVNYVRGLQDVEGPSGNSTNPNYRPLKVSACCKHFAAYDIDNWNGVDRLHFNAKVMEQDMLETFLRPFEMCVRDGDVSSVMCSYNEINGIPACADTNLLQTVRQKWNLHGYIVSDCDSIEVMVKDQKWLGDTGAEASAQTLKAGLDLDCGTFYPDNLGKSVTEGLVGESDIDRSLNYLYVLLMRVGFFDGIHQYKSLGKTDICTEEHIKLAAEAGREGIVLLKNDGVLPLTAAAKTLAAIGPHVNATLSMLGNYHGIPCRYVSPLDGLKMSSIDNVIVKLGCPDVACKNDSFIYPAMEAAKDADATIIFVGTDLSIEAEELDRTSLHLPGCQTQLVEQVAAVSKGPVILVIMSAGGVDIQFAKDNKNIKAIVWAGWPGEEGGHAIADVIFGLYNPGGRLPITWYPNDYVDKIPMTSMSLRPESDFPGRTYKFYDGPTIYPFGYGLSYTDFAYKVKSSSISLRHKLNPHQHCHPLEIEGENQSDDSCQSVIVEDSRCTDNIKLEVSVQNVGEMDGDEVVLVYTSAPSGIVGTPIKQLVAFERVFVPAKGNVMVNFELNVCKSFNIIERAGYDVLPAGESTIMVGDQVVKVEISFY